MLILLLNVGTSAPLTEINGSLLVLQMTVLLYIEVDLNQNRKEFERITSRMHSAGWLFPLVIPVFQWANSTNNRQHSLNH